MLASPCVRNALLIPETKLYEANISHRSTDINHVNTLVVSELAVN